MTQRFRQDRLDPARPTGLILCGMGGPLASGDVRHFLTNLFSDPMIIPVPRLLAPLLARVIAWRRTPSVRAKYAEIGHGGGSPQLDWTRRQGERLVELAAGEGQRWIARPAMRYWHPFPDESVAELLDEGAEQFLVVPTYPQYSDATNGSTLGFVQRSLDRLAPQAATHVVTDWHRLPGFIDALATAAREPLARWADEGADPTSCALLFVAHSLPETFVEAGDPYVTQTRHSVDAVHAGLRRGLAGHVDWLDRMPGGSDPLLAFQSRVGPIKWVGPDVPDEVRRLAAAGCRRLHVQPVSFTCEHIETLHELDIELREDAEKAGVEEFSRGAALNMDETWLASLSAHLADAAFDREVDRVGS